MISLATGRQPSGFSEISCGKSYTKIWILKGGVQGEGTLPGPCTPPFKIQILVLDFPEEMSENTPGCLPVASISTSGH